MELCNDVMQQLSSNLVTSSNIVVIVNAPWCYKPKETDFDKY